MIAPLQTAKEHFDKIKADYQSQVEKLTALVDGGVDTVDFLKVSGQSTSGCMSRLLRVLPEGCRGQISFYLVKTSTRDTCFGP